MSAPPTAAGPRRWVSCADDYALDAGAVDGILALLERGRLTATSCLVDAPAWRAAAAQLPRGSADLGLHLNLTQAFGPSGATVWPLGRLIVQSTLRRLPAAALEAAVRRQLDAFEDALGRRPDYVDGHQHVHQFAQVRDVLVAELLRRYPGERPWLRSTRPPPRIRDRKARGIALLGDRPLRARARAAGLAMSAWLVGVYDFAAGSAAARTAYQQHFARWLAAGPDGAVFMCHPARHPASGDAIAAARKMEFDWLGSAAFEAARERAGIVLVRGSQLLLPSPPGPLPHAGEQRFGARI